MGLQSSSFVPNLPTISLENWLELSDEDGWDSHGHPRVLLNPLTNQQLQQYSISFQTNEQYRNYVECFIWRQRDEHLVNTRYFNIEQTNKLCGSRINAQVYLERISVRFKKLNQIKISQIVYITSRMLEGFQKLYNSIGYFKVNPQMVGFDAEGRLKVWLNNNFSKNYIYGPHYIEAPLDPMGAQPKTESNMVHEIVSMIDENTERDPQLPDLKIFLEKWQWLNDFNSAKQGVKIYMKEFKIEKVTHVAGILKNIEYESDKECNSSENNAKFQESEVKEITKKNQPQTSKIIHYIAPSLLSSEAIDLSKKKIHMKPLSEAEGEKPQQKEVETTGKTSLSKLHFTPSKPTTKIQQLLPPPKQVITHPHHNQQLPTIRLIPCQPSHYPQPFSHAPPHPSQHSLIHNLQISHSKILPPRSLLPHSLIPSASMHPSLSLNSSFYLQSSSNLRPSTLGSSIKPAIQSAYSMRVAPSSAQFDNTIRVAESQANSVHLTYSDVNDSYELDGQLAQDMVRFLKH